MFIHWQWSGSGVSCWFNMKEIALKQYFEKTEKRNVTYIFHFFRIDPFCLVNVVYWRISPTKDDKNLHCSQVLQCHIENPGKHNCIIGPALIVRGMTFLSSLFDTSQLWVFIERVCNRTVSGETYFYCKYCKLEQLLKQLQLCCRLRSTLWSRCSKDLI